MKKRIILGFDLIIQYYPSSNLLYLHLMNNGTAPLSNLNTFLSRLLYFLKRLKKLAFNFTIDTIS